MKKYRVILYPNVNSYSCIIEAESIEEARTLAEDEASINCCFIAMDEDIKEI